MLIRSCFAGAACELSEALIVNPYQVGEAVDAFYLAIVLPAAEQHERMANLRLTVREFNVFKGVFDDKQERTRLTAGSPVPSRYASGGRSAAYVLSRGSRSERLMRIAAFARSTEHKEQALCRQGMHARWRCLSGDRVIRPPEIMRFMNALVLKC